MQSYFSRYLASVSTQILLAKIWENDLKDYERFAIRFANILQQENDMTYTKIVHAGNEKEKVKTRRYNVNCWLSAAFYYR